MNRYIDKMRERERKEGKVKAIKGWNGLDRQMDRQIHREIDRLINLSIYRQIDTVSIFFKNEKKQSHYLTDTNLETQC